MMKRLLDLILVIPGIVVLGPVAALIAILIKFGDGGSVFFRHERVGRYGKPFRMLKFRTMIERKPGALGAELTVAGDQRVTRVGRFLRKTKLDELPQLINVLLGQMSFVGPRPEVKKYVDVYSPEERKVLELKPGITDLASFAFFDESELLAKAANPEQFYVSVLIGEKIRINLEYARKSNVITDLILIFSTVLKSLGFRLDLFSWLSVAPPSLVKL